MPRGRPRGSRVIDGKLMTDAGIPGIQSINQESRDVRVQVSKDPIEPNSANAGTVQVSRQTDGGDEISTTERLFGDLTPESLTSEAPAPAEATPIDQKPPEDEEKQAEKQPEPEKTEEKVEIQEQKPEDYIDFDKLASKKVKVTIDGQSETVNLKDLRDQYQIKKHWMATADKIGEERRRLAEERRQLQELRQLREQTGVEMPIQGVQNVPRGTMQPPMIPQDNIGARIQALESQLSQVMEGTKPVMYQSNRQRVADELKSQGFDDFLDYIPKMENEILKVQDPLLMNYYDTPLGAKSLYFQLKAQDMRSIPQQKPAENLQPVQTSPQPVTRPPITKLEGGAQPSSGVNDDARMQYRQAFKRAVAMGDDREAWNEVFRQKGIIPEQ